MLKCNAMAVCTGLIQ